VCADASVYAGLSPDDNLPTYTAPADKGPIAWNKGNTVGYVSIGQTNTTTGETKTSNFITIDSDMCPPVGRFN
jgi:hypothetical protein